MSDQHGCTISDLFHALSGKWTLHVLYQLSLSAEPLRFGQLRREIGDVTTSELTKTLRNLEAMGLINRTQYSQIPVRVEYRLTDSGRSLTQPLGSFSSWLQTHPEDALTMKNRSAGTDR